MTLDELKILARSGENQFVEFKRKLNHPEKVVKEIVAFANGQGGHLLIGVDDDGHFAGLKFAEEDDYELKKAIEDLCKPTIRYSSEMLSLDARRKIIHYHIPESRKKPHYAREKSTDELGTAYYRVADRSVQASRELREILKRSNRKKDFKLVYGDTEQKLLAYIGESDTGVTLADCVLNTGIKKYNVSKALIKLALASVVKLIPSEKGDLFKSVEYN